MIRQDYILRIIEEMGVMIRMLLGQQITAADFNRKLEDKALEWIGLPLSMLLELPEEETYRLIASTNRMVVENTFLMVEICYSKAMIEADSDKKQNYLDRAEFFITKLPEQTTEELDHRIENRSSEIRKERLR